MKLIVDEMPYYMSECPFSTRYYDQNEEAWVYECTLTKEECDLENRESCKGLTIANGKGCGDCVNSECISEGGCGNCEHLSCGDRYTEVSRYCNREMRGEK